MNVEYSEDIRKNLNIWVHKVSGRVCYCSKFAKVKPFEGNTFIVCEHNFGLTLLINEKELNERFSPSAVINGGRIVIYAITTEGSVKYDSFTEEEFISTFEPINFGDIVSSHVSYHDR